MDQKLEAVRSYISLLERFVAEPAAYEALVHADMVQTEFPNALTPAVRSRDLAGCYEGMKLAPKLLRDQRYDIVHSLEQGDALVVEAVWTGTMRIDAGALKQGQALKAYLCMVFEFRDGKIWRQRNYDCYEPFAR